MAAANPKFGRFDPYQSIAQQIDLPPTLLNRFDVIFTLRDIPNAENDLRVATHVLNQHKKAGEEALISRDLFRKYIAYAKQRFNPELSDEAVAEIKKFSLKKKIKDMVSANGEMTLEKENELLVINKKLKELEKMTGRL